MSPGAYIALFTILLVLLVLAPSSRRINRNPLPTMRRPAPPAPPPALTRKEKAVSFKFSLNQQVAIAASNEQGQVIGRAEYANAEPSYYLRYRAADGRATEQWWPESAITAEPANATA